VTTGSRGGSCKKAPEKVKRSCLATSTEIFEQQSRTYNTNTLGTEKIRVAIGTGIRQGSDRFIGVDGIFIGMTGFGASAPAEKLFAHFGITAKAVVKAASQ
jgi:transketolase